MDFQEKRMAKNAVGQTAAGKCVVNYDIFSGAAILQQSKAIRKQSSLVFVVQICKGSFIARADLVQQLFVFRNMHSDGGAVSYDCIYKR